MIYQIFKTAYVINFMEKEFSEIKDFLDKHKVKYKIIEHEPVYTSEQAASVRGFDIKSGVKSLVFKITKDNHNDFVLVLVSGDKKADSKKLTKILNADNIKLAEPHEVLQRMGCEIGSCHPFGNLSGLQVYMDKRILENDIVAFNAGLHTITITMSPHELVKLVKPVIEDFAK